mgnify:CR=1
KYVDFGAQDCNTHTRTAGNATEIFLGKTSSKKTLNPKKIKVRL